MHEIIHFQTNTATVVIYDLVSLKHRVNDDADWWSLPEDEVVEINKGNVLFLNVGDDGTYKVYIKNDVEEYIGALFLNVPSGNESVKSLSDWLKESLNLDTPDTTETDIIRWNFEWGRVSVSYETQSFNHGVYIVWNIK
ncbi:DUF6386 family protein [Enterobacter hormaechei]